jgi:hypothetical protein
VAAGSSTGAVRRAAQNVGAAARRPMRDTAAKQKMAQLKNLFPGLLDNPISLGTMCQLLEASSRFREPTFIAVVR